GNTAAYGGLEIEPSHAKGGIAHEVHTELVWGCELGTHNEPQACTEGVRFPPTDVAARCGSAVEGDELVARAARVVRDNGFTRVHVVHELPDNAVGRNGHLARGQLGHPLPQPGFLGFQY